MIVVVMAAVLLCELALREFRCWEVDDQMVAMVYIQWFSLTSVEPNHGARVCVELLPFQALSYQACLIWTYIMFCNTMYLTVHSPSFFTLILSAGLVISRPNTVD